MRVKAIVIAAGLGSRMKEMTSDTPKCLLEVNGASILDRQIHAFRSAGISDISVVTGHKASRLSGMAGIKTYHNKSYRENNVLASMMCARRELDSDVLITYSDIVFGEELVHEVVPIVEDLTVVVDRRWRKKYVGRTEHPESEAEKVYSAAGNVVSIGKKMASDEASGEFIGMLAMTAKGCDVWKKSFDEALAEFAGKPFGEARQFDRAYATDLVQSIVNGGGVFRAKSVTSVWAEIDTFQDFLTAEELFPPLEK